MSADASLPPRNLRLTLAYDGSGYAGWQRQPHALGVQQVVEEALERITQAPMRLQVAGRTDAGVHAFGQVANGKTTCPIPPNNLRLALATHLPPDIVVHDVAEVEPHFHSRFSAKLKHYRYIIHDSPQRVPHLARYVYWRRHSMDTAAMQAASQVLLGEHDFRSFGSDIRVDQPTRRNIFSISWSRMGRWNLWSPDENTAGDEFLCFDIVGDGFLYNMVRTIVGTLVHVGRGRWNTEDIQRILAARDRGHAGETAPACGLYLMSVAFPEVIPQGPARPTARGKYAPRTNGG